jgi:hypothetical protein
MSRKAFAALMLAVCVCTADGQTEPAQNAPAQNPPAQNAPAQAVAPGQTVEIPPGQAVQIHVLPSLTPGEVYKQAMHPLDQVRSSLENWSDAELGALATGMHMAHEDCQQRKPEDYHGDDLYDLAHLCAFGQDWEGANSAATLYIARGAPEHRTQAYALIVNALMHQNAVDLAVQTTQVMLDRMPYDAEVAFTVRYMKDALEQAGNPTALNLAAEEHAKIVQALKLGVPLKAANDDAVMDVGSLYDSAMVLAFLQRYAGQDSAAAATAADCEGALAALSVLAAEDGKHIETVRLRYRLLGAHLPNIVASRALISATAKAQLPRSFGAGTVLVLFPDWCAQCRRMMKVLTEFNKVNATTPLYAYGLVFVDDSLIDDKAVHDAFVKEMQGTPTYIVPAATAQNFGAIEFPLAIVTDATGTVRFIGGIPGDAFKGGGYIEKVIVRMTSGGAAKPN